jgi:hypothetical protein
MVSQGIRSGAGQVTAPVTDRVTRPAIPHVTGHAILPVILLVIPDIAYPIIPRIVWQGIITAKPLAEQTGIRVHLGSVVIAKWKARGLTEAVLQAIRTDVFNVVAPVAP